MQLDIETPMSRLFNEHCPVGGRESDHQRIAREIREFEARGGEIGQIPTGVSGQDNRVGKDKHGRVVYEKKRLKS